MILYRGNFRKKLMCLKRLRKTQNLIPRSSYSRDFCSADSGPVPVRMSIVVPDADS